jgi:hypothetical protein
VERSTVGAIIQFIPWRGVFITNISPLLQSKLPGPENRHSFESFINNKQKVMKRKLFLPAFLLSLIAGFVSTSCSNSGDDQADLQQAIVQENLQSGEWRITSFIDSGKDETSHFNGYTFRFDQNGSLISTNGNLTYTGSWSITDSNSNDDSPDTDIDFNILFTGDNHFEDLSEDWHIVSQSETKIVLIHVSGGNGGTDNLTFEKG